MRPSKDAGEIMRDWEILCFFCLSLFPCLIFVFFQSDPVNQGVQLEEKRGGQYQRVAATDHEPPAIPVVVFAFPV